MATGYLRVKVMENITEKPIQNADITIEHENQPPIHEKTDARGLTQPIPLVTVDKSLSYNPDSLTPPFFTYQIKVKSSGYREETVGNIYIFDGQTTNQTVEMHPINSKPTAVTDSELDSPVIALFGSPLYPFPIIPLTISVKLGTPNSNAEVILVNYRDYIKNVVSSEIFPTWPEAAIRANIYAIQSLALNRVYTEWYRQRGYNFQITSSTAFDMKYTPGLAIFSNVSDLVDSMYKEYIHRLGFLEPLFAAFCDGKKVKCDGLHQWKTVDYANLGYEPIEILKQFYGDNIEISSSAIIQDVAESFPGDQKLGSAGPSVFLMQMYLLRISLNYPAIPQPFPLDGVFDDTFEESVKQFQRVFNLPVTGIIDRDTWYKIAFIYQAVKRLGEITSEGTISLLQYLETTRSLKPGDSGLDVLRIQYVLNVISPNIKEMQFIKMDSKYGGQTKTQVEAFQRHVGLPVTGIIDPKTWELLVQYYEQVVNVLPTTFELADFPGRHLTIGEEGLAVQAIQRSLNAIARSYQTIPQVDSKGVFDQAMEDQVKAFQAEFNLPVTGIIDEITWNSITDIYRAVLPITLYPGYALKYDDTNYYVGVMQYYLNSIAEKFPNIPKSVVDPWFGPETKASVIAFQNQFGLEPTGIVDKATWNRMLDIYTRMENTNQDTTNSVGY